MMEDENVVDITGNRNLIEAIKNNPEVAQKLRRFVLASAVGVGDSSGWIPSPAKDSMWLWLLSKSKAESAVSNSGLPYTILRLCPLDDVKTSPRAILTTGPSVFGAASRRNVAKAMFECVNSLKALNKVFAVVDEHRVMLANPYVRSLDFFEDAPFEEFILK